MASLLLGMVCVAWLVCHGVGWIGGGGRSAYTGCLASPVAWAVAAPAELLKESVLARCMSRRESVALRLAGGTVMLLRLAGDVGRFLSAAAHEVEPGPSV